MKKVIEGKLYNTETAEEICEWSNGLSRSDFGFCEETLFRTKKGNWFLHGRSGASGAYSSYYAGMRTDGAEIIPMDSKKAVEWLERRDFPEIIEELFPELVEEA